MLETLYEYYATQNVRPTYASFSGDEELSQYAKLRKHVFYRLMLPPSFFAGKRLLEFGPDTGENSLVFGNWGAHLTLVEPNAEAHSYIRRYFSKFGLDNCLQDVVATSLLQYQGPHKFDVIDAEGFIYTIQPNSAWITKTGEFLERDGFLIISYMEFYGGFIELLTKAIYQHVAQNPAYGDGIETAKNLFLPKWNRVQHTRKIESWFMDVIENPFVRLKYYIDSVNLLKDMRAGGFRLYSSWPNYKDALSVQWIKQPIDLEYEMHSSISFIEQSRLSHLLGCKCFFPKMTSEMIQTIASLVRFTDELIDTWTEENCANAISCVNSIESLLEKHEGAIEDQRSLEACQILVMVKSIFQMMEKGSTDQLVNFCRNDNTFLSNWGTPNHYAVFQLVG